ncbi:hypothetical protein pb186bvf_017627 [Paramecium bursaria]
MEQQSDVEIPPQNNSYIDNSQKEKAELINIALFEFMGTALLVYGSMASNGQSFGISLIYFVCLIFFGRISGGHFNPIITLVGYIDGSIDKKKALYFIGPQFAGAILSAMILLPILNLETAPYFQQYPGRQVFGTMIAEVAGSTIFFTFVQMQTVKDTKMTTTQVSSAIFLAAVFFVAREFTISMDNSLFNPAAAFALETFYVIYYGQWNQWINMITYMVGPWLGSLLAITFYWKVYVPTYKRK